MRLTNKKMDKRSPTLDQGLLWTHKTNFEVSEFKRRINEKMQWLR